MNLEIALETMMEECDQFRDTIAVSKENRISNRATITPTNPPIDCAGVSVTPRDATISSRSVSSCEPSRKVRPTPDTPNWTSAFQGVSRSSFFSFTSNIELVPTVLGACLDTKQHRAGVFHETGKALRH